MNKSIPSTAPSISDIASQLALTLMQSEGKITPTCILATPREMLIYREPAAASGSEEDKDNFVFTCRMLALAYKSQSAAIIIEAWGVSSRSGAAINLDLLPSQCPDRYECVFINNQVRGKKPFFTGYGIERDPEGKFAGFKDFCATMGLPPELSGQELEIGGRFANVLPVKSVSESTRKHVKSLLSFLDIDCLFFGRDARAA